VIELRFHRDLYDGKAVDEALKTFGKFASFEQREEPSHWVVQITGKDVERERRIANELANFALGLTIKSGGTVVAA
jgi:hypothetical protein